VHGSPSYNDHCIGRRFRTDIAWHEKAIAAGGDGEETMMNRAKQKLQAGKAAGIFTNEFDRMPWLLEKGHLALMVGEANAFLIRGARAALDAARQGGGL